MYLHLGQFVVLSSRYILGIFDLDTASAGARTRAMLKKAQEENRVITVGEELPKSFLLYRKPGQKTLVYLSQLSSQTLLRRWEQGGFEGQTMLFARRAPEEEPPAGRGRAPGAARRGR